MRIVAFGTRFTFRRLEKEPMLKPVPPPRHVIAAVLLLAVPMLAAGPALAQGTAEQQEACTPDAVRLCSATIPDIAKTTACMKAHVAQLSPRCRAAFADATAAPKPHVAAREERSRVVTREERSRVASREERRAAAHALPERAPRELPPRQATDLPVAAAPAADLPGLSGYRAEIAQSCREGLIDPFTCRNTLQALSPGE